MMKLMVTNLKKKICTDYGIELTDEMNQWLEQFEKGERKGDEHETGAEVKSSAAPATPKPQVPMAARPRQQREGSRESQAAVVVDNGLARPPLKRSFSAMLAEST